MFCGNKEHPEEMKIAEFGFIKSLRVQLIVNVMLNLPSCLELSSTEMRLLVPKDQKNSS